MAGQLSAGSAPPPGLLGAAGRVVRNALWLLISQGGTRLIGFVLGTVLARYLGAGDFGAYMFVMTYVSYFGFLADAGLGRYLIRDVARDRAQQQRVLAHVLALRLVLGVVCYVAMVVVAWLTATAAVPAGFVAIAGLSLFTGAAAGALASAFNAREEMRVSALFGLLSSVTTAAFVLGAAAGRAGLAGLIIATAAANLPPLLFLLWSWRRRAGGPRLAVDLRFWRHALRESYPYAILGFIGLVYFRMDALMLAWMQGAEATGIYTAAYRLLDAATDIPGVLVAAAFPAFARLHQQPRATLRRAHRATFMLLAAAGVPVMAGMMVLAGPVVSLLYGSAFQESVTVLRLLSVAVFLIFADTANTMVLYSGDRMRLVMLLSVVTTAANLGLNFLLIPRYSYNGAAVATILSTALSLLIFTPTVLRYLREEPASSS